MKKNFFTFPSEEEWNKLIELPPIPNLFSSAEKMIGDFSPKKPIKFFHLQSYYEDVCHRLDDISRGYVFMVYYYGTGYSDEKWHTTPEKKGDALEFYPELSENDALLKSWFDFYSDATYHKLFSVWDLIGHILNIAYELNIKLVYFEKSITLLKEKDGLLHDRLTEIINTDAYKLANKIRNDTTHNLLPNVPGLTTYLEESQSGNNTYRLGFRNYLTSGTILENIQENLNLLTQTFICLSDTKK